VAVGPSGDLIGCGQLKPHAGGLIELASIAVLPAGRGHGAARAIIEFLLEQAPRPLYLTCRGSLGPFYQKWGFRPLKPNEMPVYFLRLSRIAALLSGVLREEGLLVMMLK
jgi:N-acetylglutamate synthase-like GNAT family acetyltransferase